MIYTRSINKNSLSTNDINTRYIDGVFNKHTQKINQEGVYEFTIPSNTLKLLEVFVVNLDNTYEGYKKFAMTINDGERNESLGYVAFGIESYEGFKISVEISNPNNENLLLTINYIQ